MLMGRDVIAQAQSGTGKTATFSIGILQQVDTPSNLYKNPKNVFVAGFIGSPAMNIFKGSLENKILKFGKNSIELPEDLIRQNSALKNYNEKEVIFGFRPEHLLEPLSDSSRSLPLIKASVRAVEELGNEHEASSNALNEAEFGGVLHDQKEGVDGGGAVALTGQGAVDVGIAVDVSDETIEASEAASNATDEALGAAISTIRALHLFGDVLEDDADGPDDGLNEGSGGESANMVSD